MTHLSDFLRIAITPPDPFPGEWEIITLLLRSNDADLIHLRHPEYSEDTLRRILLNIPEELMQNITLHDHFRLLNDFPVGGIHLNSRNPSLPSDLDLNHVRISRSCHSISEVKECQANERLHYSYVTLSPIFNSISKPGYNASFNLKEIEGEISDINLPVIALGGVTESKFPLLKSIGFRGAAMLGAYFPADTKQQER
ncbi:MAG: thiamine phosphate synthase [Muribaculaceae bacterium]|nr:thiamine phosphate synthase [Muribaculaceae bacterium]